MKLKKSKPIETRGGFTIGRDENTGPPWVPSKAYYEHPEAPADIFDDWNWGNIKVCANTPLVETFRDFAKSGAASVVHELTNSEGSVQVSSRGLEILLLEGLSTIVRKPLFELLRDSLDYNWSVEDSGCTIQDRIDELEKIRSCIDRLIATEHREAKRLSQQRIRKEKERAETSEQARRDFIAGCVFGEDK